MRTVAELLMKVTAVVVAALLVPGAMPAPTAMLSGFSWADCGVTGQSILTVTSLDLSAPLTIPGPLVIKRLEATVNGQIPDGSAINFVVQANSSFGPSYPLTIPCFPSQGGSCGYGLCDILNEATASSVTRQVLAALLDGGLVFNVRDNGQCRLCSSATVRLVNRTLDIPSMLHTTMDSFINTNNYNVTAKLVSPSNQTLGCLSIIMPVYKTCLSSWMCPKPLDDVIALMNPTTTTAATTTIH